MTDDEFRIHGEGLIDKAITGLMGHFDAVQIFVTRQDGETTMYAGRGKGNYYARLGMIHTWLDTETEQPDDEESEDE